jgi:hypothetical protein
MTDRERQLNELINAKMRAVGSGTIGPEGEARLRAEITEHHHELNRLREARGAGTGSAPAGGGCLIMTLAGLSLLFGLRR